LRKLISLVALSRECGNGGHRNGEGEKADAQEPLAPLTYAAPMSVTMIAF
jgi:hypothetical protein